MINLKRHTGLLKDNCRHLLALRVRSEKMDTILPYSSRFTSQIYTDIAVSKWNAFVINNDTGYAYLLYEMMLVEEEEGVDNISFVIIDNISKEIVLLMPLYLKKSKSLNSSSSLCYELISRNGIVIKDDLPHKYKQKLSGFFVSYVDGLLEKYCVKDIFTETPSLCNYCRPDNHQIPNPLIDFGFSPRIRYTWVVNLNKEESRILKDCEETTRQAIRKYIDNDEFLFTETNQFTKIQDCMDFIDLSEKTYERSSGKAKSRKYYRNIFDNLIPETVRVFFLKSKMNNEPIATAAILIFGNTAEYFLAASAQEKPIGINKYLMYKIMIELKRSGIIYFETGGAYPYLRDASKRKGISDFKKSFGTFLHAIHGGCFYSSKCADGKTLSTE